MISSSLAVEMNEDIIDSFRDRIIIPIKYLREHSKDEFVKEVIEK